MAKEILLCVIFTFILPCINVVCGEPFFRKDYTYIEETNSFYKISCTRTNWFAAKKQCALEGAQLMIPENKREVDMVHEKLCKNVNALFVWVGLKDHITEGVDVTIDGRSIDEVYTGWSNGEPNNAGDEDCALLRLDNKELNYNHCTELHNYICKKTHATLDLNLLCDIPNKNYTYNNHQGKCYKLHKSFKSWNDAHATCIAEQSYLAVVNSKKESDVLVQMIADENKLNLPNGDIHIGFHNRDGDGWVTVKGTTLEVAGYDHWADGKPEHNNEPNYCGAITFHGDLNEVTCDTLLFFICEHDIGIHSSSVDTDPVETTDHIETTAHIGSTDEITGTDENL